MTSPTLGPSARRTLHALVGRLAPPPVGAELATAVEARIARLPAPLPRDLQRALLLLGVAPTVALGGGGWRAFHTLPPSAQDAVIEAWMGSALLTVRMAIHALRRLVLVTAVADGDRLARMGMRPPSHTRPPEFAWEGPADGAGRESEPIARGAARPHATELPATQLVTALQANGRRLTTDVVIIGSGAGGAVAAARLAAAGLAVLIVEAGDDVPLHERSEVDSEMMERLYAERGARSTTDRAIPILQGATVGGGTVVNWMMSLRTPDHVLDEWTHRFGTADMSPADLRPVFERLERELRVRPVPDDAHSANNQRLIAGAAALGWRHSVAPINADQCLRAGTCGLGCVHGAKQDARQVHLADALRRGARLLPRARVERIDLLERHHRFGKKRLDVVLRDGGTTTVEAPIVVCAAGAVETPVLLQRSGLGGDRVGDFLRLHPTTSVLGVYDEPIHAATGIPLSVMCDEFAAADPNGYGFWIECPPMQPSLMAVALPGFGAEAAAWLDQYPHFGSFIALVRDGTDRGGSSGSVRVTRDGRPRIHYELAIPDAAALRQAMTAAGRLHFAAGSHEVRTLHRRPIIARTPAELAPIADRTMAPHDVFLSSAHVNGTCRITADRRSGGCSPEGERWGAPGLFVVDGSVLPTAPGVNPQLTIMAMADVIATRIAARYRSQ